MKRLLFILNICLFTSLAYCQNYPNLPDSLDFYYTRWSYKDDLRIVKNKTTLKYGIINRDYTLVCPCIYDSILDFETGFMLKFKGKWGFFLKYDDKYITISPIYKDAIYYRNDLALVKHKSLWGIIDRQGKTVVKYKFIEAHDYLEGLYVRDVDSCYYSLDFQTGKVLTKKVNGPGHIGPKIKFDSLFHDFDTVTEGSDAVCSFVFYNIGDLPLQLVDVHSTGGCCMAIWPKVPFMPGDKGVIKGVCTLAGWNGLSFHKSITVTVNEKENGQDKVIYLFVKGYVSPKKR